MLDQTRLRGDVEEMAGQIAERFDKLPYPPTPSAGVPLDTPLLDTPLLDIESIDPDEGQRAVVAWVRTTGGKGAFWTWQLGAPHDAALTRRLSRSSCGDARAAF